MIRQLAHICIHTLDLDQTLRFYTDVLGMEKGFDFERKGEPHGYYLKLGGRTYIEVFPGDPGEVGNINHVAFEVDDMDGLMVRIREQGVDIGEKKLGADHSWQVWLTDPNGIRIELHEYTPDSLQLVGGTCHVNW